MHLWARLEAYTRVESPKALALPAKYQTRAEVTESVKHSSLFRYGSSYDRKKIKAQAHRLLTERYNKTFLQH
jgi:hypothetical protein